MGAGVEPDDTAGDVYLCAYLLASLKDDELAEHRTALSDLAAACRTDTLAAPVVAAVRLIDAETDRRDARKP